MVAYVWPVRSVYLPLLSTYSNYSFFLWRTRRGIDFSPPVSVFTYIIYNILYFQPPSYIYMYIYIYIYCIFGLRHRSVASRPPDGQCRKDSWQKPWPIQTDDQRFGHGPSKLRHTWPCPPKRKRGHDAVQESTHYTGDERWPDIKIICFLFSLLKIAIFFSRLDYQRISSNLALEALV